MSNFKPTDFKIKDEKGTLEKGQEKVQVVKLNSAAAPKIAEFSVKTFDQGGTEKYAKIKARYGALAMTDADRSRKTTKDKRFTLNPLIREPLSVEDEEQRAIDNLVKARVDQLAAEATKKAEESGYQEGLKKGYDEAFAQFKQEGDLRLERFLALVNEAEMAKEQIFRSNERFLIELIYKISRMVLLKELKADKEYLVRLVRDIIERVGVKENITIKISEEDAQTAAMLKEGLEKVLGSLKNLNVEISTQVKSGGCIVETEWNAIDAGVDTQLAGLYEALTGSVQGDAAGDRGGV